MHVSESRAIPLQLASSFIVHSFQTFSPRIVTFLLICTVLTRTTAISISSYCNFKITFSSALKIPPAFLQIDILLLYCFVIKTSGTVYNNPTFTVDLSWNHALLQPIQLKRAIESVETKLDDIQVLPDCGMRCKEHFRNNDMNVIRYSLQSVDWTRKKMKS